MQTMLGELGRIKKELDEWKSKFHKSQQLLKKIKELENQVMMLSTQLD